MKSKILTNHGLVLCHLVESGGETLGKISRKMDITERAVQRIVTELENDGIITRAKSTMHRRANHYTIHLDKKIENDQFSMTVLDLLSLVRLPLKQTESLLCVHSETA